MRARLSRFDCRVLHRTLKLCTLTSEDLGGVVKRFCAVLGGGILLCGLAFPRLATAGEPILNESLSANSSPSPHEQVRSEPLIVIAQYQNQQRFYQQQLYQQQLRRRQSNQQQLRQRQIYQQQHFQQQHYQQRLRQQQIEQQRQRQIQAEQQRQRQLRIEAERRAQEAARRAQAEAAKRAQEEAARKAQAETAKRAQEEAARKAQAEAAKRAQEEAEAKAKSERQTGAAMVKSGDSTGKGVKYCGEFPCSDQGSTPTTTTAVVPSNSTPTPKPSVKPGPCYDDPDNRVPCRPQTTPIPPTTAPAPFPTTDLKHYRPYPWRRDHPWRRWPHVPRPTVPPTSPGYEHPATTAVLPVEAPPPRPGPAIPPPPQWHGGGGEAAPRPPTTAALPPRVPPRPPSAPAFTAPMPPNRVSTPRLPAPFETPIADSRRPLDRADQIDIDLKQPAPAPGDG